jgi:hypothetical protein
VIFYSEAVVSIGRYLAGAKSRPAIIDVINQAGFCGGISALGGRRNVFRIGSSPRFYRNIVYNGMKKELLFCLECAII